MIVVDTSAIVAMAFGEPERDAFVQVIQQADKALISTVSVLEARMAMHGGKAGCARCSWRHDNSGAIPAFVESGP